LLQLAFYFEGSNDRIVLAILTWGDEIGGVQAQAVRLVGPD